MSISKIQQMRDETKSSYINRIKKSWTYNRMTDKEKKTVINNLNDAPMYGRNKHEMNEILNAIYKAFLDAIGYSENPVGWREPATEEAPF